VFSIDEELKKLPKEPGIYIMRDKEDLILYVGKAINLKNRVRSYFRESTVKTPKIKKMVSLVDHFEYMVTDSELEALVLENNLIKEHKPKYNTLLKDDKTYPFIKVTVQEEYPRILFSRIMKKDRAKYFGPFAGAKGVKETIELISKLYQIRTCNKQITQEDCSSQRACLNYHMKQCLGPCIGSVSKEEYQKRVDQALLFLSGNHSKVIADLTNKMNHASDNMEFETAIYYRDLIENINSLDQSQKITTKDMEDKDIIAMAQEGDAAVVQVFFVRSGKLIGREHFHMTNIQEETTADILRNFIIQFYAGTPFLPKQILVQVPPTEMELIEDWLKEKRGSKVKIITPKIGDKEKLVELALKNAAMVLKQDRERIEREETKTMKAVNELVELLQLQGANRIEAYDISNISGFENVGSMVVFEKGKTHRSDYRKFKIKTVSGPDDYACMREVLSRRFRHGIREKEQQMEGLLATSFTKFPDLILMDGGKGQVNIAKAVLEELGMNIPVCGMVKDDHHNTRGLYYENEEIEISKSQEAFKLVTRIQDEAHRFAIEYHRLLRRKNNVKSVLEEIPGIGLVRRKALMREFDTIDHLRAATIERLCEIPEMNQRSARSVLEFFKESTEPSEPL